MKCADSNQVFIKSFDDAIGQHRAPVLATLAIVYRDLTVVPVDILDPQSQDLHDTQAGTVHNRTH